MEKKNDDYPFEIKKLEENANEEMLRYFTGEHTCYLQIGEKKWCFPSNTRNAMKDFYNMEVRPSDVWIVTFPRSGTTLTLEMIWLLMNNLNYAEALNTPLERRCTFLEYYSLIHPKQREIFLKENAHSEANVRAIEEITGSTLNYLNNMTDRRFIKTHLPLSLLPKTLLTSGCKVIYVARNPKDVAASYYHHNRLFRSRGYTGDFPTYWQFFTQNSVVYTPYWEHVLEAWNKKHEENFIFLFYDRIIKDVKKTCYDLQKFIGTNYTDEEICTLENHLSFDNFKNNKSVNYNILYELGIFKKGEASFVRQGNTGNSKKHFSEQEDKEANEWIAENLKGTDFKFPNE